MFLCVFRNFGGVVFYGEGIRSGHHHHHHHHHQQQQQQQHPNLTLSPSRSLRQFEPTVKTTVRHHDTTSTLRIQCLVGGWATPLKNMKVSWDDDIPNIWETKKWQPNHQPDKYTNTTLHYTALITLHQLQYTALITLHCTNYTTRHYTIRITQPLN